jgi:hypothetical protein
VTSLTYDGQSQRKNCLQAQEQSDRKINIQIVGNRLVDINRGSINEIRRLSIDTRRVHQRTVFSENLHVRTRPLSDSQHSKKQISGGRNLTQHGSEFQLGRDRSVGGWGRQLTACVYGVDRTRGCALKGDADMETRCDPMVTRTESLVDMSIFV